MYVQLQWVLAFFDCVSDNLDTLCIKLYDRITRKAENLVKTGTDIEATFGIPVVNKRVSVTPISLIGAAACRKTDDYVKIAETLDRAAKDSRSKIS